MFKHFKKCDLSWCGFLCFYSIFVLLSFGFFFSLSKTLVRTNIRSFLIVPEVPREPYLFIYLSNLFFLFPRFGEFYCFVCEFLDCFPLSLQSSVKPIHWVLVLVIVFFSSEIFGCFFLILYFFPETFWVFVSSTFIISNWSNYSNFLSSHCWNLFFFHSVWNLYSSWYDEWVSSYWTSMSISWWIFEHYFMKLFFF